MAFQSKATWQCGLLARLTPAQSISLDLQDRRAGVTTVSAMIFSGQTLAFISPSRSDRGGKQTFR